MSSTQVHQPKGLRVLERHQLFPSSRDVLWQIQHGIVRTKTVSEDGLLIVLGYWGTGELVGHAMSKLRDYQIECLTEVEVSLLPHAQWSHAVDALLRHIQQVQEFLRLSHQHPIRGRLWQLLTFLAQKFGVEAEQGVLIDLNLTHQELAETINVTRVTVTRLLQTFEDEGLLLRQKKQLILLR